MKMINKKEKNLLSSASSNKKHKSVLVDEVIQYINPKPGEIYIDATFGSGGHSEAILKHEKNCKVIAIDLDKSSIDQYAPKLKEQYGDRFKALWGNFSSLYKLLKKEKISKVDGILADFGTSQMQIHQKDGFSFQKDTPLDMRMSKAHSYFDASFIVNKYSEKELTQIFFTFGEEKHSRKIAKAIVEERKHTKIHTTYQLVEIVKKTVWKTEKHKRLLNPATKIFQALRIYVNKELDSIKLFLPATLNFLKKDGRLLCISFHSLEDRIVKNFFKSNTNQLEILTKKPILASEQEIQSNFSSRSSKLRVAQKIIN
jgi:16S rRNA (cytosine1402-N4)-methyltransferase